MLGKYVRRFVRSPKLKKATDVFEQAFQDMKETFPGSSSGKSLGKKCIKESLCSLELPFLRDEELRNDYINHRGDLRVGLLLEDMDVFGGYCAYSHCAGMKEFPTIVTASMDQMDLHGELNAFQDLQLVGAVTYAGNSSMNVDIDVATIEPSPKIVLSASFTFVARDRDNNSLTVPKVDPSTEIEQSLLVRGKEKQVARKKSRLNSLTRQPPTAEELKILHSIFTERIKPAGGNLEEALTMKETRMQTTIIAHPQMRNVHNKVFGGYLMRKAYELAWANANLVTKGPVYFVELDDIFFRAPVEVGSLVEFQARSSYSYNDETGESSSTVSVSVHADVMDPLTRNKTRTNTFEFVFSTQDRSVSSDKRRAPELLPVTYEEGIAYLMARRRHNIIGNDGKGGDKKGNPPGLLFDETAYTKG